MPEILTKHPDIVMKILNKSGAARCGQNEPQTILTKCPSKNFCALKGGELCVYGLEQLGEMTQFSQKDVCAKNQNIRISNYGFIFACTFFFLYVVTKRNQ